MVRQKKKTEKVQVNPGNSLSEEYTIVEEEKEMSDNTIDPVSPYLNMYQGVVKPMQRPWQKNAPAFQAKHIIGGLDNSADVFTVAKVWLHKPTFEFPRISAFLSLSNGKGSCFARIGSPQDLRMLAGFLVECSNQIESKTQELAESLTAIDNAMKGYADNIAKINQLQQLAKMQSQYSGDGNTNEAD